MTPARWTVAGIVGVLVFTVAWLAWGLGTESERVADARRQLVGEWNIHVDWGDPPELSDGCVLRVMEAGDGVRVTVDGAESDVCEGPLERVRYDPTAWDVGAYRFRLHGPDHFEIQDRPSPDARSWQASATR